MTTYFVKYGTFKELLKKRRSSQAALCKSLDIDSARMSRFVNGLEVCPEPIAKSIAENLDTTIGTIFKRVVAAEVKDAV